MKSISTVRVRYAETDQMGMVYHSNFFVYFEIGRTDFFRESGFTYRMMEQDNVFMPVVECYCRYLQPAFYDDELCIQTQLEMLSRLRLKFLYQVTRKVDSRLIAEGYSVHFPTNPKGKPCRIPSKYLSALNSEGAVS